MASVEDIKEYFHEDEWNAMSSVEKTRMAELTFEIQVFPLPARSESKGLHSSHTTSVKSEDNTTSHDNRIVNIKTEDEDIMLQDTYIADNSRDEDVIYCEDCKLEYEDFCSKCSMLSRILDKAEPFGVLNRASKTLPGNILEVKLSPINGEGIFALKIIPKGVIFGPFEGVDTLKSKENCSFKLKTANLIDSEKQRYVNWMLYVNSARHILEHNLTAFQHDGDLYYRSMRQINKGEELLVFYGEHFVINPDTEDKYYQLDIEDEIKSAYACSPCCLGFNSKMHLLKHQTKCPSFNTVKSDVFEKIRFCPLCRMYLCGKEFLYGHTSFCQDKNKRKAEFLNKAQELGPKNHKTTNIRQIDEVLTDKSTSQAGLFKREQQKSVAEQYKCTSCKYNTKDLTAYKKHLTIHYSDKHQCKTCGKIFIRKRTLEVHMLIHSL